MSERGSAIATVASCAALGSVMAGASLGALIAISLVEYSDSLREGLTVIVSLAFWGAIVGLVFGGTVGFAVGLFVSRFVGTSIGHAALVGALAGTSYPLFFLIAGLLMDTHGLSMLAGSFVMFIGLGATYGALAHWLVVGRGSVRSG